MKKIKLNAKQWFYILSFTIISTFAVSLPIGIIAILIGHLFGATLTTIFLLIMLIIIMFILIFKYNVIYKYLNWIAKLMRIKEKFDNARN